jgi:hypothetical protein
LEPAAGAVTSVGKQIPLHWSHSPNPEDVIGHVNPSSAKAVNGEVVVSGWVDRSTERGREVWRLAKSGTLGFSFGFLVPKGGATRRPGGGKRITALDVYEVSATAAPANPNTRVLSTKAASAAEQPHDDSLQQERTDAIVRAYTERYEAAYIEASLQVIKDIFGERPPTASSPKPPTTAAPQPPPARPCRLSGSRGSSADDDAATPAARRLPVPRRRARRKARLLAPPEYPPGRDLRLRRACNQVDQDPDYREDEDQ